MSTMLCDRNWAATSARMTTKGNFEVISFETANGLPKLSVIPWGNTSPLAPSGHASPKMTMHKRVANNSREAMVLKGSPRDNPRCVALIEVD